LDTATYVATAQADGYQDLNQTVPFRSGRTDTVVFNMQLQTGTVAQSGITPGRSTVRMPVDSNEVRFSVSPTYADVYVDGTKVGSGRVRTRLPVGPHQVRYFAQGCTAEEIPISVQKGEPQIIPSRTLTCQ
jgi:hypothetical protein